MFVDGDDYIDTDCIGGICTYLKNIDSDVIGVGSHHVHVNKIEDHCYTRVRDLYNYRTRYKAFIYVLNKRLFCFLFDVKNHS